MVVLVTCKNEEDPIENGGLEKSGEQTDARPQAQVQSYKLPLSAPLLLANPENRYSPVDTIEAHISCKICNAFRVQIKLIQYKGYKVNSF